MTRPIDADALKEVLSEIFDTVEVVTFDDIITIIDNAPTVAPDMAQVLAYESGKASKERPKGEWISDGTWYADENGVYDFKMYRCNLCKRVIMTAISNPTILFPYCHCGADMREGDT